MIKPRTALYRHYNLSGELLYIGISANAMKRIEEHKKSHWVQNITRIEIQYFDERDDAKKAESLAIKSEFPLFNIAHKPPPISEAEKLFERIYNNEDFGDQPIYFQNFDVLNGFIKAYKKYANRCDKQNKLTVQCLPRELQL